MFNKHVISLSLSLCVYIYIYTKVDRRWQARKSTWRKTQGQKGGAKVEEQTAKQPKPAPWTTRPNC